MLNSEVVALPKESNTDHEKANVELRQASRVAMVDELKNVSEASF